MTASPQELDTQKFDQEMFANKLREAEGVHAQELSTDSLTIHPGVTSDFLTGAGNHDIGVDQRLDAVVKSAGDTFGVVTVITDAGTEKAAESTIVTRFGRKYGERGQGALLPDDDMVIFGKAHDRGMQLAEGTPDRQFAVKRNENGSIEIAGLSADAPITVFAKAKDVPFDRSTVKGLEWSMKSAEAKLVATPRAQEKAPAAAPEKPNEPFDVVATNIKRGMEEARIERARAQKEGRGDDSIYWNQIAGQYANQLREHQAGKKK